jgi:hypothetical protein
LEQLWDQPRFSRHAEEAHPAHRPAGSDRGHDGRSSFRAPQAATGLGVRTPNSRYVRINS